MCEYCENGIVAGDTYTYFKPFASDEYIDDPHPRLRQDRWGEWDIVMDRNKDNMEFEAGSSYDKDAYRLGFFVSNCPWCGRELN